MKIALVTYAPHEYMGGIENYIYKLIKIFSKGDNVEITEFLVLRESSYSNRKKARKRLPGIKQVNISGLTKTYPIKPIKFIEKNTSNFDLVINNTNFVYSKKLLRSENFLTIQHEDLDSYDSRLKPKGEQFKLWLDKTFLGISGTGNWLLNSKSRVLFPTKPSDIENPYVIPLSSENLHIKNINRDQIIWLGRIDKDKGVDELSKISNATKSLITVYGDGSEKYIFSKENLIKGGFVKSKNIKTVLSKGKVLILTSPKEGFAFTIVEALSAGVPVILFNSFKTANYYGGCEAVSLIDPFDSVAFAKEIDRISNLDKENWDNLSKEAMKFASKMLSEELFKKKWDEIIKNKTKAL